jgi:hypothetical protein
MTRAVSQEHDPPHSLGVLRARRERPRGLAAEQRYELAPSTPNSRTFVELLHLNDLRCRILATNCEMLARFSPQTAKPESVAAKYA